MSNRVINGKGSKSRVTDHKAYREGFDWQTPRAPKSEHKTVKVYGPQDPGRALARLFTNVDNFIPFSNVCLKPKQ